MNNKNISHAEMVATLVKPGRQIFHELTEENLAVLLNQAKHLVQSGNALDSAKKQAVYNKDMGMRTLAPIPDKRPTPEQLHMLHMTVGIAGEAAELLEAVLQHIAGAPLDMENMIEEFGDIEFYMEGARQGIDVTREQTLEENISKLSIRYEGFNYSDTAANARADKA